MLARPRLSAARATLCMASAACPTPPSRRSSSTKATGATQQERSTRGPARLVVAGLPGSAAHKQERMAMATACPAIGGRDVNVTQCSKSTPGNLRLLCFLRLPIPHADSLQRRGKLLPLLFKAGGTMPRLSISHGATDCRCPRSSDPCPCCHWDRCCQHQASGLACSETGAVFLLDTNLGCAE